jgi:hypothetical protein
MHTAAAFSYIKPHRSEAASVVCTARSRERNALWQCDSRVAHRSHPPLPPPLVVRPDRLERRPESRPHGIRIHSLLCPSPPRRIRAAPTAGLLTPSGAVAPRPPSAGLPTLPAGPPPPHRTQHAPLTTFGNAAGSSCMHARCIHAVGTNHPRPRAHLAEAAGATPAHWSTLQLSQHSWQPLRASLQLSGGHFGSFPWVFGARHTKLSVSMSNEPPSEVFAVTLHW